MIEVELFDGTILEFPEGTSQEVIQRVARERTAAIRGEQQPEQPQRSFGKMLYENVIGSGEVDTPGERLGQLIRGGTAAVARGMADVPAIPANLAQLATAGVERALGMEQPSMVSRALESLPDTREMLAAVPVIGPESQYVAPGTAGEYISTMGEFAGGAGLLSGPSTMVRFGALPGAASEFAGQRTEGTALEPYARTAAALGTSLLASRPTGRIAPIGGADDEAVRMAETMRAQGIQPTAGQILQSPTIRRMEGTVEALPSQIDDLTAAAMRSTGSEATRATPAALREARNQITSVMDDAISGVTVRPTQSMAQRAIQIAEDYRQGTGSGNLVPRINNIANEILDAATSRTPRTFDLQTLRRWRTQIGPLRVSSNPETARAANQLNNIIDDAIDQALTAAGRSDDIQRLNLAREQYRNFLAVRDASTRAGAEGGLLSPTQLNEAVKRTQGRSGYALGTGTDLAETSRASAGLLRSLPTVEAGGIRRALPEVSGAGVGAGLGFTLGGAPGAFIGGALGAGVPTAGQFAMRSAPFQSAVLDPFGTLAQQRAVLPGLLSQ